MTDFTKLKEKLASTHEWLENEFRGIRTGRAVPALLDSIMVDAYKQGLLSLGQVAKALEMPKEKVMKMLSMMGIDVIDYDFEDDIKNLDSFL